jgi:hypothetical protein
VPLTAAHAVAGTEPLPSHPTAFLSPANRPKLSEAVTHGVPSAIRISSRASRAPLFSPSPVLELRSLWGGVDEPSSVRCGFNTLLECSPWVPQQGSIHNSPGPSGIVKHQHRSRRKTAECSGQTRGVKDPLAGHSKTGEHASTRTGRHWLHHSQVAECSFTRYSGCPPTAPPGAAALLQGSWASAARADRPEFTVLAVQWKSTGSPLAELPPGQVGHVTRADQEIPGPPNRDPDSRFRGNRGFPVSRFRPSRESGIDDSPDFPKKNRGNRESDFLSDEYQLQWTRNMLSREYHASPFTGSMRLLFGVRDSEREHAAVSDERPSQLQ